MEIGQAGPVALILNELVCNALKHAFPGGRSGAIHVTIDNDGEEALLAVADDGVGLVEQAPTSSTLGLQLVSVLAEQLHGRLAIQSPPGTHVSIRFPAAQPSRVSLSRRSRAS